MEPATPLFLLFDAEADEIGHHLVKLIAKGGALNFYDDGQSSGAHLRVIFDGITLELECSAVLPNTSGYKEIFGTFDPATLHSAVAIGLDGNVAGGETVPPIAAALLKCGAYLCSALNPNAVMWRPAAILSDPHYFSDSIMEYAEGGVFPALPLVDFGFSEDGNVVRTTGLHWFSGQEVELHADDLPETEMVRRLVRIVHDIAVNGPVAGSVAVGDLDDRNQLVLEVSPDGASVTGKVRSKLGHLAL